MFHYLKKFHSSDWKERLALLDKFKDDRLVTFGHSLIYNEAPEILPKDIYKKIKRRIASRILVRIKKNGGQFQLFILSVMKLEKMRIKCFHLRQ